jgi:membrane associated rhomboid family serine protease
MTLYSRLTLRSIPELAPFTPSERVLLWNRAAKAAGLEYWFRVGFLMGLIGGLGGGVGSNMDHPLVGAALGGLVSGVVVTLLMSRPLRRSLHHEILKLAGTA